MCASRRGRTLCLSLALLALLSLTAMAVAQSAPPANSERSIVVFADWSTSPDRHAAAIRGQGGTVLRHLRSINAAAAVLPPGVARKLARRADVLRVDPDIVVSALVRPDSPPGKKTPPPPPPQVLPWGVDRIDAEYAWSTTKGAGVRVAVVDTGIDRDHPDLQANIAGGVNFVARSWTKPADPNAWDDDNGHGSHVAGIIAAVDNDIGVIGVAPEASLYAVKVLDKTGRGYLSDIAAGLEWCADNGIDIANMSLGTDTDVQSFHDACDAAADAGVILVAAAGNDGKDVDYPGAYSSVLAVAATDDNDNVASWSSPGPQVAIAAPGVSVYSTWKGGGYNTISGTSMATPHVSGTLALVLAAGRSTNLCATADDLPPAGIDNKSGCGLVDAQQAVTGLSNGNNLP
jgi:subtilisin